MDAAPTNRRTSVVFIGVLLCTTTANASSNAQVIIKDLSSLRVKVLDHRERPVQGAEVVLETLGAHTAGEEKEMEQKKLARLKTDEHGEFIIDKLAPGNYEVSLNEDVVRFSGESYRLEATKGSKRRGEIVFHWPPPERVIVANTLSGTLRYWETAAASNQMEKLLNRSKGLGKILPLPQTELSLFRFLSNEKVTEAHTDGAGRFDFRVAEPGLYYMRFKFEGTEETLVVDLNRNFIEAAPLLDVLLDDFIITGEAPRYRSLNGGVIHDPRTQR